MKTEKVRKENLLRNRKKTLTILVLGTCIGLLTLVVFLFNTYIRYPKKESVVYESTRLYCLVEWEKSLQGRTEGYIGKELLYSNGSEVKNSFKSMILGTVSYSPKTVTVKNVRGEDYINPQTKTTEYTTSYIEEDEEVTLSYIDYSKIELNRDRIREILETKGLNPNNLEYKKLLAEAFCGYILSLNMEELPIKSISYVPSFRYIEETDSFCMSEEEDIYIDELLFSSEELKTLFNSFSVVSADILNIKDYSEKEYKMEDTWCGAYYLETGYIITDDNGNVTQTGVSASVGDGSYENPIGLNSPVISTYFNTVQDSSGNNIIEEIDIRITLREFNVSERAIEWLSNKDSRNRGIDLESEVQYYYAIIEIENLSDKTVTFTDNSTLSDKNINISSRVGTMFGISDSITLKSGESGCIETWGRSTELNKKYLIWGKDFNRKISPIWFRVLSGDIEDTSENKGVHTSK